MLGLELINLKKGRKKADEKIKKMEDQIKTFVPQDLYRDEFETYEKRIRGHVETQLGTL